MPKTCTYSISIRIARTCNILCLIIRPTRAASALTSYFMRLVLLFCLVHTLLCVRSVPTSFSCILFVPVVRAWSRFPLIRSQASKSRACPGPLGRYGSAYQYSARLLTRSRRRHLYHAARPSRREPKPSTSSSLTACERTSLEAKSMPRVT